jgi:hypothetical protein
MPETNVIKGFRVIINMRQREYRVDINRFKSLWLASKSDTDSRLQLVKEGLIIQTES